MRLYDAHNHFQDRRFDSCREEFPAILQEIGLQRAVVNGTREDDWERVGALSTAHDFVLPSFGLHPWYVPERSNHWRETLIDFLNRYPGAVIGEVGLDRWIEGYNLEEQTDVFVAQLDLALERELPVTIHCLKAWGALCEVMRSRSLPKRGFLLHAYGGPAEMVAGFVKLGAYFSFSTYFLHPRKGAQRNVFRAVPLERLLVETDAPDMAPPPERSRYILNDSESHKPLNHPANLLPAYEELAGLRGIGLDELAEQVESNFQRLFRKESAV